jgi:hypothetical protein
VLPRCQIHKHRYSRPELPKQGDNWLLIARSDVWAAENQARLTYIPNPAPKFRRLSCVLCILTFILFERSIPIMYHVIMQDNICDESDEQPQLCRIMASYCGSDYLADISAKSSLFAANLFLPDV